MQYWWMETVCHGKCWDVALAERDGKTEGLLPYCFGRKMGLTYILQPQLTQYSGPFLFYPDGMDENRRVAFEHRVCNALIDQMMSLNPAVVVQHLSPRLTNWLPFYWNGFEQTTRYTYRIEDISNPDKVFAGFDHGQRQKKIVNLQRDVQFFVNDVSPEEFALMHVEYWRSRGRNDLLDNEFIAHVCRIAISRNSGFIASLRDAHNSLVAARFVVYDEQCAFSLMSAFNRELYFNGAGEVLVWNVLCYLSDKTKAYDFEGSMDKGVENFYRSFGAVQTQYFEVSKYKNWFFRRLVSRKRK